MGKHDTCQNSLHSFSLTLAAATNKCSANTFQRLHKRQKLNAELTATYKYCSFLVTCLVYSQQLNYIHIGKQYLMRTQMLHAVTLLSYVYYYLIVIILHSKSQTLWDKKWAHLYPLSLSPTGS
jgi:hypothetical protein